MRSPEELRRNFAEAILHVRSGRATSRRTLADVMGLSPTTAGLYVDTLIESGHLHESGLERGRMGRPKRALVAVADAGWFAGIEFNAERVQALLVDFSGAQRQTLSRTLPSDADAKSVLKELAALIVTLKREAAGPLLAIGVGAPGVVDPRAGVGIHYSFLRRWCNVPIRADLRRRFGVPVILENNLRAIALAERWFGGGRNLDDYVILGPRSGFGIAVMKHGRLIDGQHHAAGEIGRWIWPLGGEGGEVHDALSSPAVWRRLAGATTRARLPSDIHAALNRFADSEGDSWNGIVADYGRVLGLLHLLLDSPAYFLHGPLTALGTRFCNEVATHAARLMPALRDMPPNIIPSALGDDAGAQGAACMAMEAWAPS